MEINTSQFMTDPCSAEMGDQDRSMTAHVSARSYCWVPTMNLEPGMVIARPVLFRQGINAAIHLPVGTELKANTIAQLVSKGVECVAVEHEPMEAEALNALLVSYTTRINEIFGPNPDVQCRLLMEALLEDGPCQC